MKEIVTTMTKKGQVTIPVEIRNLLGLKAKDKIAFRINKGGDIKQAKAKYTLESVYGAVKLLKSQENFKELKKTAIKEHARKIVEEMKK